MEPRVESEQIDGNEVHEVLVRVISESVECKANHWKKKALNNL